VNDTNNTDTESENSEKSGLSGVLDRITKKVTCQGITKRGAPCTANATASGYCPFHDPNISKEEKLAWATKGGYSSRTTVMPDAPTPELSSPEDVTNLLQETTGRVLRGEISPAVANAIGYLASISLRSFELDVARKIAALEAALAKHNRRGKMINVTPR
jgi:hypothetical protein